MKKPSAVLYTGTYFSTDNGKLAHGLVRGTERFDVIGVIDTSSAASDAGEILDGLHRGIPVFGSLKEALEKLDAPPAVCIFAVATAGGRIPGELKARILEVLNRGISIINCLHELLSDDPAMVRAAASTGAGITDIRKPKPFRDLHFFSGEIRNLQTPRIAVLGTDCAVGKRTTALMLLRSLRAKGISAEMIYTGQTGYLQGLEYGFILDATPNDFVSGELEHQVLRCDREKHPQVILIEGQSSLRNPSGPCGSELILSAGAETVILQHNPKRPFFDFREDLRWPIPSVKEELEILRLYGARVSAITLQETPVAGTEEYRRLKQELSEQLGVPVFLPLSEGTDELAELVLRSVGVKE